MSDIEEIKKMITDPENYSGVMVTNKEIDLKKIW